MPDKQTASYGLEEDWVQVGDDSWLPRHFTVKRSMLTRRRIPDLVTAVHVEVVDPSRAAGVTLYDEASWPTPVARWVEVVTIYGEVQDKDLRAVRIVDMVEAGAAALVKSEPTAPNPGRPVERDGQRMQRAEAPPAPATAVREVTQARAVLRHPRVDLGVVAKVYIAAQQEGRRDPTVAVSEHIGKARSTAAAYVNKARQAKLLLPPGELAPEGKDG